jgi:hypothetical protein
MYRDMGKQSVRGTKGEAEDSTTKRRVLKVAVAILKMLQKWTLN